MSEWSAWGVVVLVIISFLVYDMFRRAKEKIYIKAYTEIKTENGSKTFSELDTIGEFKGDTFNARRRCYEFKFRKNFEYFTVFSNYTMTQLMEVHKIERVYFIYYSLNAYVFERKLKEPYEKELGWSIQAYIYRCLSFLFNITPSGICCSLLICGSIFYFSMPQFPLAFLIGCVVGFLISTLNYFLRKSEIIKETLLKKKKQTIETEIFMSPLESEEEVIDIYEVKGTIQKEIMTSDDVTQTEKLILRNDDSVDYKTVEGYDELYDLLNNPLVQINSYKIVDMKTRKRTNQEMLNLRRSYLSRNRAFAEDLFRIKEETERLQRNYRDLEIQMQHVLETKDKELNEMSLRMIKEQSRLKNTLKHVFAELMGSEFVGLNFDQKLLNSLRIIEQEKQAVKADKLDNILKAIERLFELIAQKANVDLTELMKILKINEVSSQNGEEEAT